MAILLLNGSAVSMIRKLLMRLPLILLTLKTAVLRHYRSGPCQPVAGCFLRSLGNWAISASLFATLSYCAMSLASV